MNEADELRAAAGDAVAAVARLSDLLNAHLAAEVDIEFPPVDPPPAPPAPAPEPPPPAPAPEPAPEPEPAPPPAQPAVEVVVLGDGARIVAPRGYHESGDTYDRFQRGMFWSGKTATVMILRVTQKAGEPRFTPTRVYTLLVDGVPVGEVSMAEWRTWGEVKFDPSTLPGGWLRVEVAGVADGEVSLPWHAHNDQGQPMALLHPVYEGSHKTPTDRSRGKRAMRWEASTYTPKPAPLARRLYPPVDASTPVHAKCVTRPERSVNITIPAVNKDGVVSAHGMQSYFWYHRLERWPKVPLLDGPRGVGTHPLTTHIEVGMAERSPGGEPMNTFYFSDPWRVCRGNEDGSTTTLVGYRHAGMASYWEDGAQQKTLELVGDWDGVPLDRRGLFGVTGFCFSQATLAVDMNAQPIAAEGGRLPHVVPPKLYIAEQRESGKGQLATGRIVCVEFSAVAHGVPPRVTELVTGLAGPWSVVDFDARRLIVSLRNSSQIITVDKETGAVEVLLAGDPALAQVQDNGKLKFSGSLSELRAQITAPECLKLLDGHLYIGSYAAEGVMRMDPETRQLDPDYVVPVKMERQSWFVEFALSDGSFGPRGTVFAQTWGQPDHAGAYGTQPDGAKFTAHASAAPWDKGQGYPCAVAVAKGRLYTASSNLGLNRYGARASTDFLVNADLYFEGERLHDEMHGNLQFGSMGFGNHGHPLPWGLHPALDHYYAAHDAPR